MLFIVLELPAPVFFTSEEAAAKHAHKIANTHTMGLLYVLEVKSVVGPKISTVPVAAVQTTRWLYRWWKWGKD